MFPIRLRSCNQQLGLLRPTTIPSDFFFLNKYAICHVSLIHYIPYQNHLVFRPEPAKTPTPKPITDLTRFRDPNCEVPIRRVGLYLREDVTLANLALESWSASRALPSEDFITQWERLYLGLTLPSEEAKHDIQDVEYRVDECVMRWKRQRRLHRRPDGAPRVEVDQAREDRTYELGRFLPWLLAGSLISSAKRVLEILDVAIYLPADFKTRADCLIYLRRHWWDWISNNPSCLGRYNRQVNLLRRRDNWPCRNFSRAWFLLMVADMTHEEGRELVRDICERSYKPSPELLLRLSDYCRTIFDVDGALECLRQLPQEILQTPPTDVLTRCTLLLRQETVEIVDGLPRFKVFSALLEMGLQPDSILHSLVIEKALHKGLSTVAWDLFWYAQQHMHDIAPRTHLLLLKDAFESHNIENLNMIMSAVYNAECLAQNPQLTGYTMNIVQTLYRGNDYQQQGNAFERFLTIYDRAYNRSPLIDFQIAPARASTEFNPSPQPRSLGFTLWAYILIEKDSTKVFGLWERFKTLVEEGNSTALATAQYDLLYNAMILYCARQPSRVSMTMEIFQYMLEKQHCPPTALTWSLLMCAALKYHGEPAARNILYWMKEHVSPLRAEDWGHFLEKSHGTDIANELRDILAQNHTGFGVQSGSSMDRDMTVESEASIELDKGSNMDQAGCTNGGDPSSITPASAETEMRTDIRHSCPTYQAPLTEPRSQESSHAVPP